MKSLQVLLIGAGHSRSLKLAPMIGDHARTITTLDFNPTVNADLTHDLQNVPWPLKDSSYDEVHAYEVLEHLGHQGDFLSFFETFEEIYRVLKPNGYLCATCPSWQSIWAWGDPGHTRIISPASLVFLDQTEYTRQLDGATVTSMSDYRYFYGSDFKCMYSHDDTAGHSFILQAIKPARIKK